jgi:hypothetical protein
LNTPDKVPEQIDVEMLEMLEKCFTCNGGELGISYLKMYFHPVKGSYSRFGDCSSNCTRSQGLENVKGVIGLFVGHHRVPAWANFLKSEKAWTTHGKPSSNGS